MLSGYQGNHVKFHFRDGAIHELDYSKTRLYRTRLDQHFLSVMYEIRYTRHV
jgi:hypothetical protein